MGKNDKNVREERDKKEKIKRDEGKSKDKARDSVRREKRGWHRVSNPHPDTSPRRPYLCLLYKMLPSSIRRDSRAVTQATPPSYTPPPAHPQPPHGVLGSSLPCRDARL
jgi:hypothetical protein